MGTQGKRVFSNSTGRNSGAATSRESHLLKHLLDFKVCVFLLPRIPLLESKYQNDSTNMKGYMC